MAALTELRVRGTIRPPGDKSISHRALILAAIGGGPSRISRILDSADIRSTASALRLLGADIPQLAPDMTIPGIRANALRSASGPLDCGNSGTSARLLAGVVAGAGAGIEATFVGDASLARRPMRRIAEPLGAMGADIQLGPNGGLPMTVRGAPLHSITWVSPVASAQVKSAILLAAVLGGVGATVTEPHPSRDHTERMLRARGVTLTSSDRAVTVEPSQQIEAGDAAVPADLSSAAFFVALALIADAGELRIEGVGLNPTRTGFLTILQRMGASIDIEDERTEGGEPIGTIVARPSSLRGVSIDASEIPGAIDELPMLACLAARAEGETAVAGAGELRVKESDRIAAIVQNLQRLGADAHERADGFVVRGTRARLSGHVESHGDHRIAMAFGVLAASAGNAMTIDDTGCADVSYPGFWRDLERVQA